MTTQATEGAVTTTAPTADPVPAATTTPDADGGALAMIQEAITARNAPATETPAAEKPADPPPAVATKPADPPADVTKLFDRLTASEQNTRALEQKLRQAEERASKFDKLLETSDPASIFSTFKLTPEAVVDFVENGSKAKSIQELANTKKTDAVEQRIAQLEGEIRRRDAETVVSNYKRSVTAEVDKRTGEFPSLGAWFGSAAEAADQIVAIQQSAYNERRVELTFDEAAGQLESILRPRVERVRGKAPVTPVTNQPAVAAAPAKVTAPETRTHESQDDGPLVDNDEASALAIIRNEIRARNGARTQA